MRVVNFNIKGAFVPGRKDREIQERSWHQVAAFGADLVLLQEVEEKAIPDWVHQRWTVVKAKAGVVADVKNDGKNHTWGSVIAAAALLNLRTRDDLFNDRWLAAIYEYVVIGEINLPDGSTALVASVHATAEKLEDYFKRYPYLAPPTQEEMTMIAGGPEEPWMADFVIWSLDRVAAGKRFIIGGDWNNSRLFDCQSPMRRRGQGPISTMFFTRAEDRGWFECHGSKNEERSYIGNSYNNRPHQLDHLFCDKKTAKQLVDCSVRLDWLTPELSDHVPMVTEFKW
jgi:exonuclease III